MDETEITDTSIIRLYECYVRPFLEYTPPVWHGFIMEKEALDLERFTYSEVSRQACNGSRLELPS